MSQQAVQLQWSLDSTTENALKIGLKLLQVATGDNVQPSALLACERFGSTLPICHNTRKVIEMEARPNRDPVFLTFSKAFINQGGELIQPLSQ